jgi:uncharacterized membrane protein YgdD (TMEM256/DUF423 family)
LLAISGHPRFAQRQVAAGAIALGTALFSGSIFMLVLLKAKGKAAASVFGPITPLGGSIHLDRTDSRSYDPWWMGWLDSLVDVV